MPPSILFVIFFIETSDYFSTFDSGPSPRTRFSRSRSTRFVFNVSRLVPTSLSWHFALGELIAQNVIL